MGSWREGPSNPGRTRRTAGAPAVMEWVEKYEVKWFSGALLAVILVGLGGFLVGRGGC